MNHSMMAVQLLLIALAQAPASAALAAEPAIDRALQRELLEMSRAQKDATEAAMVSAKAFDRLRAVSRENTEKLKQIVEAHGWPGKSLVGPTAASAAWKLLERVVQDPLFQEQMIPLLEKAVQSHELDPQGVAAFIDRTLLARHRPQRYGTKLETRSGKWAPLPMEDPAHVDERRAAMGLPPLARQQELMRSVFH